MKFLFLLLISFPLMASVKVEIKNLAGESTHGSVFETNFAAESWVSEQSFAFGKPERTIPKSEATEDELESQLLEEIPAEGDPGELNYKPEMVKLKKTYTVTITDITQEVEDQKAFELELANDHKCLRSKARLRVNNKRKGLTKQQKAAFLSNPEAKKVMDALNVCSIDEAKALIQAWPADGLITTEQDKVDMLKELE